MAEFGRCKGRVLVLQSGLTCVPFHHAGAGYHAVVIAHTVLGVDDGMNFVGRAIWISEQDIIAAEVIPSYSLIGLAAAYGPTHLGKENDAAAQSS